MIATFVASVSAITWSHAHYGSNDPDLDARVMLITVAVTDVISRRLRAAIMGAPRG